MPDLKTLACCWWAFMMSWSWLAALLSYVTIHFFAIVGFRLIIIEHGSLKGRKNDKMIMHPNTRQSLF
jgi:hypothetical protein